ncbi:MAG: DUF2156 domain-containing protein [Lachnospiraceae bacterium]|nr:DUF2156 domain-containing protein [Lachnospiraceae bacterium]
MSIDWKEITLKDKELIRSFYQKEQPRSCELTFANNILWSSIYQMRYAIVEGALVFGGSMTQQSVSFPIGREHIKEALDELLAYFEQEGKPFRMHLVTKEQFEILQSYYPGKFQIAYDRDVADYVYETEKLITLSGKKLHSKRNHINRFLEEHENWSFEFISAENKQECLEMAEKWRDLNGCDDDPEKSQELCVTMNAIRNMEELGLTGGLIRLDGKVIAISLGEQCSDDTFVVHIEKAFADIQGAYPIINQQFAKHVAAGYRYVNREEDTGAEGLRKAKLSYRPAFLQEKGIVTLA